MGNSEFGLEAIMFPDPPEISTDPSVQKSEEDIIQDIGKIAEFLNDMARHHDGFKEALVRNFVSAVGKIDELNVGLLIADLFKVGVIHLGPFEEDGARFVLDGPNRQIKVYDSEGTLRIRFGFVGGAPKFEIFPASGEDPEADPDAYLPPTKEEIDAALDELRDLITDGEFDPNTFDWSTLTSLIPFNKITGVTIGSNMISAGVIIGNIVAANAGTFSLLVTAIANIINLNAQRITAGEFDPARLPPSSRGPQIQNAINTTVTAVRNLLQSEINTLDQDIDAVASALFDPNSFDWSTLTSLIPFEKITGVQITQGMIAAPVIIANIVAATAGTFGLLTARIARLIELNADRITAGELAAARITGDVKNVRILFNSTNANGKQMRHSNTGSGTLYTLESNFSDFDELEFLVQWDVKGNASLWNWDKGSIPVSKIGSTQLGNTDGDAVSIQGWEGARARFHVWGSGRNLYCRSRGDGDDNEIRVFQILGITGPKGSGDSGGGDTGGTTPSGPAVAQVFTLNIGDATKRLVGNGWYEYVWTGVTRSNFLATITSADAGGTYQISGAITKGAGNRLTYSATNSGEIGDFLGLLTYVAIDNRNVITVSERRNLSSGTISLRFNPPS